ncbi:Nitroreductase, partial [human gut metagenome]
MNTLECIKTRHSTRKFKADQLSRKLIDQVLDAGRRAPSGGNTQLTHFMVITNQVVLKELVTLVQEEYGKMP